MLVVFHLRITILKTHGCECASGLAFGCYLLGARPCCLTPLLRAWFWQRMHLGDSSCRIFPICVFLGGRLGEAGRKWRSMIQWPWWGLNKCDGWWVIDYRLWQNLAALLHLGFVRPRVAWYLISTIIRWSCCCIRESFLFSECKHVKLVETQIVLAMCTAIHN